MQGIGICELSPFGFSSMPVVQRDTGGMSEDDRASVTPIDAARRRRAGESAGDAMDRILNAGIDLARAERVGHRLDEAELLALNCCDEIGGVRGIVASEVGDPYPRDPEAPTGPGDPRYDF